MARVSPNSFNVGTTSPIEMTGHSPSIVPEAGKDLDTKQLIGKRLSVEVSDHSYPDQAVGTERSVRQATGFKAA